MDCSGGVSGCTIAHMDIPADGPKVTRATITFQNLPPGLFISGEKLKIDATNLRRAARLLQGHGGAEEEKLAAWFLVYADQCLNAACGMEAIQTPDQRYDRPPQQQEQQSIPDQIGD